MTPNANLVPPFDAAVDAISKIWPPSLIAEEAPLTCNLTGEPNDVVPFINKEPFESMRRASAIEPWAGDVLKTKWPSS